MILKNKHIIFSLIVMLSLLVPILIYNQSDAQIYHQAQKNYLVQPGDSLWSIAANEYPQEHTGKMVYKIARINEIHDAGSLRIGTELQLP